MTAQAIRSMPDLTERYEMFRVVLDYEALQEGIADRIADLNVSLTEVDEAGQLTRGNMQRLLTSTKPDDWRPKGTRKQSRAFGWETLGKALQATGLALVLVIDDERFAPVKAELAKRERPVRTNVRIIQPRWLITARNARQMVGKRWAATTQEQRTKVARRTARARWRKRRLAKTASDASPASAKPATKPPRGPCASQCP